MGPLLDHTLELKVKYPVCFSWRVCGIPQLSVSWQYVGAPDTKCPAVIWSHLL